MSDWIIHSTNLFNSFRNQWKKLQSQNIRSFDSFKHNDSARNERNKRPLLSECLNHSFIRVPSKTLIHLRRNSCWDFKLWICLDLFPLAQRKPTKYLQIWYLKCKFININLVFIELLYIKIAIMLHTCCSAVFTFWNSVQQRVLVWHCVIVV